MVHCRVLWCIVEYYGALWSTIGYCRMLQGAIGYYEFSWLCQGLQLIGINYIERYRLIWTMAELLQTVVAYYRVSIA